MAEPRRIPLETVKPLAKEKKTRENPPTHRFTFSLGESNDRTCPEFSYAELVKSAKGEKKEPNPDDPYGEDEDDEKLRELARKFEEKYGPKVAKKKRKRMGKWEDYVDRGMGYDETDPFIDNDEAYDELVPSTLTTRHGGFYINSGELEFRRVSESDSDNGTDESKTKKRRRRRLELVDKESKRRRRIKDGDHVPKKRGRKPLDKALSALNKEKQQQQRKMQPTVATLLQQRKADMQRQQAEQEEQLLKQLQDSPLPAPLISSSDENELYMDIDQSQDLNLNKADFDKMNNVIESVIKCSADDEQLVNNNNNGGASGGQALVQQLANNVQAPSSDSEEMRMPISASEIVDAPKLPENLPPDLNQLIDRIKQIALSSEEGKCKFFSEDVNRMLLGVEIKTRELSCTQRSMIYSHLASYLPCTKETLLKRVKKLRIDQEGGKLREPMFKLREAVTQVMPRMLEKYGQAGGRGDPSDVDGVDGSPGEDNGLNVMKKFEWNEVVRELLCEVVSIKLKCYEVSKMRTQSAEEYLLQFLEADVKDLWPTGWMQGSILYKESRSAHAYLTTKPKKPLLVMKKLTPGVPNSSDLFPSAVEVVERNLLSISARGPEVTGQCLENYPLDFKDDDLRDLTTSSSRLVIATSPLGAAEEKELPSAKPVKIEYSPTFLGDSYKNFETPVEGPLDSKSFVAALSPKKLFQSSEELQKSTPQTSFAAQMLDKIICASLADFPNSGTSTVEPSCGKLSTSDLGVQAVVVETPKQHQLPGMNSLARDDTIMKPPSMRASESVKTSQAYNSGAVTAVSILKSNYNQPPPQQSQQRRQRPSVLDHGSGVHVANVGAVAKQSHIGPTSPGGSTKNSSSTMPYQPYEFQEAFKRSLGIPPVATSVDAHSYAPPRAPARTKKSRDELVDEPMNFSAPNQSNASHYASQELTRFASTSLPGTGHYGSQQTPSSQSGSGQRRTSSHSVSESFATGFMAEGMKGFPLPIKSGMSHGGGRNMTTPPPAHSYPPSHRTPPNETGGLTTTSPHRHNSLSPHSPTHGLMNASTVSSNHGTYPSTAPLSHYSPSPSEMPHNRSLIQGGPWRVGSTSPTHGFSAPSQYSNANTSVTYTTNTSSQGGSQMGYPPASNQQQQPVHKRNIPSPAHQSSPTHQPLSRNMYNHPFTNAYSTSQSLLGQYPESHYTISNSHPLSPYHGGPPIASLTGTGQRSSQQQRIP